MSGWDRAPSPTGTALGHEAESTVFTELFVTAAVLLTLTETEKGVMPYYVFNKLFFW